MKWNEKSDVIKEEAPETFDEEKIKWDKERTHLLDEIDQWEELYVKKIALRDEELDNLKA